MQGTVDLDPAAMDPGAIAAFAPPPPAPKVSKIQPWSSQSSQTGLPTKLDTFLGTSLPSDPAPAPEMAAAPQSGNAVPPEAIAPTKVAPLPPTQFASAAADPDTSWQNDPEVQASSNALQAAAIEFRSLITSLLGGEIDEAPSETGQGGRSAQEAPAHRQPQSPLSPQTIDASQLTQEASFSHNPAKPRLSMPKEVFQQAANVIQSSAEAAQPNTQTHTGTAPAPRVYPFRPLKKIDSVAAVDLPTFPRPT